MARSEATTNWDQATLVDPALALGEHLLLRASSPVPADNFPGTTATAGVAVRRPQAFLPTHGELVTWTLRRLADGMLLQEGVTFAEEDGLVAVGGLTVTPDPERVRLTIARRPVRNVGPPVRR